MVTPGLCDRWCIENVWISTEGSLLNLKKNNKKVWISNRLYYSALIGIGSAHITFYPPKGTRNREGGGVSRVFTRNYCQYARTAIIL